MLAQKTSCLVQRSEEALTLLESPVGASSNISSSCLIHTMKDLIQLCSDTRAISRENDNSCWPIKPISPTNLSSVRQTDHASAPRVPVLVSRKTNVVLSFTMHNSFDRSYYNGKEAANPSAALFFGVSLLLVFGAV